MKISASVKILVSIFFLVAVSISCKKEEPSIAKEKNNTAEVRRLTILADGEYERNEYESAIKKYKRVISIADISKDRIDYVDAIISLGYIYQEQGNYIESEAITVKALSQLKYLKKKRFAWNVYFILGFNYFKNNDTENALLYFRKSLNINSNAWRNCSSLNALGIVYMKQNNFKKAISIFKKITTEGYFSENYNKNNLTKPELIEYSMMVNNLGLSYFNLKDPRALNTYKKALQIRLKTKDDFSLSNSYTSLSEYYLKENKKLSRKYALLGYQKALKAYILADKMYCLNFLVKTTEGNELKKYTNLYIHLTDSVNNAKLKQKNQFSNVKYNFRKDKEQNLELKAQNTENELEMQRQKNRSFISYLIIFISSMAFVFIVFYVIKKGKKESNAEVFKNEMRISEKLQFELEKDIDKILLFSENHNLEKEGNKEEFLSYLNNIYSKTRNISRKNSEIATGENFEKALKEMISGYTSSELNIIINGLNTFSWSKIDRIKKITIYRVVQEIMDLMKTLNNASLASITFKKEDKKILITYIDNGSEKQDYSTDSNKRFSNIENRLKSVKGFFHISLNANRGFKIFIKLPI